MEYLFLALGGAAGGFINGYSGTATALFSLSFFLVVLAPAQAVAVAAILSVFSGLQGVWEVRKEVRTHWRRIALMALPGLAGVPLGLMLLERVNATTLRFLVAIMLLLYGGYFGFRKVLPAMQGDRLVTSACVGFVGGVLGGLASLAGALPSIWFSMFDSPRTQIRALLQMFNVIVLATTAIALGVSGVIDSSTLVALCIALPVGFVAAHIGIMVFRRVSDTQYRRSLILLCLGLGISMFVTEVVSLV